MYDGYPVYRDPSASWYIWYDTVDSEWTISTAPGTESPGSWVKSGSIPGEYNFTGTYTGTPDVIEIP